MPCYCNDISNINKDIQILNRMLAKVNSLSNNDASQTSLLTRLSSNARSAATPDNIHALTEKSSNLNNRIANNRESMSRRITTEINTLKTRLTSLRTADERYHDLLLMKGR